jgi:catalase
MRQNGDAQHFVLEAFKHCKALCVVGEGVQLLASVGVEPGGQAPAGVVVADTPPVQTGDTEAAQAIAQAFVAAIGKHRHWDRAGVESVPA